MPRKSILVFITLICASPLANASFFNKCMFEGRVVSTPKYEFDEREKIHVAVFQFEISKADALGGAYEQGDCFNKIGKTFEVEIKEKINMPQFVVGDQVRIQYKRSEMECIRNDGGSVCSFIDYKYVPIK